MDNMAPKQRRWTWHLRWLAAIFLLFVPWQLASASPASQEADPPTPVPADCKDCHLNIADSWAHSPHAHAYDDPVFQDRWSGLGKPGECLVCHTTAFQSSTGEFSAEGVDCAACHGNVPAEHPPAPVPILADTEYCGVCHTTTLGEWRLTGHATSDVGCTDCHNPHDQAALFESPDEMCLNCHKESMGDYLEDIHVQKNIGCVDCHALVIPPESQPDDGIVPTGHTFTITPGTCVACHTDTLHAGFSLPGYENGAGAAHSITDTHQTDPGEGLQSIALRSQGPSLEEEVNSLEIQLSTTQAALASRNMTILFQGAVVGLVLGGSTAWIVANNIRRQRWEAGEQEPEDEEE